ncbi:MAG: ribonuclease Z [Thermoplasmata archaeon]
MQITFLGTAGSWPTKDRSASAIALDTERELVLLDCGEGTQRQFFHSSVSFMKVRRVFITHFHGDHFLGLPGLIQSMCLNNRTDPLDVYGPPDAKGMIQRVLELGYFTQRFPVEVHPLAPGASVELDSYTVRSAPADHPVPALAYRIEEHPKRGRFDAERGRALGLKGADFRLLEKGESVRVQGQEIHPSDVMGPPRSGRSIVYSGDSAPSDPIRKLAHRASLLIHEATTAKDLEGEANQWGHSSARQAAQLAAEAEVEQLFLTHFSSRYKDVQVLEEEARELFPTAVAARDLADHLIRQL